MNTVHNNTVPVVHLTQIQHLVSRLSRRGVFRGVRLSQDWLRGRSLTHADAEAMPGNEEPRSTDSSSIAQLEWNEPTIIAVGFVGANEVDSLRFPLPR